MLIEASMNPLFCPTICLASASRVAFPEFDDPNTSLLSPSDTQLLTPHVDMSTLGDGIYHFRWLSWYRVWLYESYQLHCILIATSFFLYFLTYTNCMTTSRRWWLRLQTPFATRIEVRNLAVHIISQGHLHLAIQTAIGKTSKKSPRLWVDILDLNGLTAVFSWTNILRCPPSPSAMPQCLRKHLTAKYRTHHLTATFLWKNRSMRLGMPDKLWGWSSARFAPTLYANQSHYPVGIRYAKHAYQNCIYEQIYHIRRRQIDYKASHVRLQNAGENMR